LQTVAFCIVGLRISGAPAVVLSELLGLSITGAVRWTTLAGLAEVVVDHVAGGFG
jgi:hypothetical protein